jgi:hypothetical protein
VDQYPEIVKVRIAVYEYCKWPQNRMSNGENPFLSEYCRNKESLIVVFVINRDQEKSRNKSRCKISCNLRGGIVK